ncbi:MAG TPA: hypothetical protein VMS21_04080 [Methylomirabilota bacterium]|nr:hypothetical protein [Methylomirabilota bacterium]
MPLSRRQFIQADTAALGGLAAFATGCVTPRRGARGSRIQTVLGPVSTRALGTVLPHEHVLVDFIGADRVSRDRYGRDEAFAVALPHLQRARELGCATLFECTPAYLGRDPELLRALAIASGLQLVTNTGYYGAANDRFLPAHAFSESAGQLANRVLLSHDAGWYHVGEPGGGQYRSHETLFTQFLPALRRSGFREEELDQMLVRNPADAFGIRVRDA